jgi:hypothetical protein
MLDPREGKPELPVKAFLANLTTTKTKWHARRRAVGKRKTRGVA